MPSTSTNQELIDGGEMGTMEDFSSLCCQVQFVDATAGTLLMCDILMHKSSGPSN